MRAPHSKLISHIFIFFILLAALPGSAVFVTPAHAAGISVNSNADTTADDAACTLREAIANANSDAQLFATAGECAAGSGNDTITFNSGLSGKTIHLVSTLILSSDVTIDGSALAAQITLSGDSDNNGTGDVGVFSVSSGVVTLNSLIITKGSAANSAGINNASGGTLTITNSTLTSNTATGGPGGGIRNDGTLTVTNSTFSNNSATGGSGGGIRNTGALTVTNSTFSGNTTTGSGGGIYNVAGFISVTITNSTFSGNAATSAGGGIYYANSTGTFSYANTIIANSTSGGDCTGDTTSNLVTNTNNLVEDGSCSTNGTNFLSGDPNLGPLADNGGPTQTFALLTGSSAIDAGDATTCANSPVSNLDQRGVTRLIGAHCDIGAYEHPHLIVTKLADTNDGVCNSDCSLREAIAAASSGSTITITFDSALSGGTIYLNSTLTIVQNMTIDGSELASKITVSGDSDNNGTSDVRVFFVHSGMTVALDSLIITKGNGTAPSGEGHTGGGGIQNNTGNNSGAALTITNSIISGNSADNGGGILNTNGSTLTLTNSTISGNTASGNGGGIYSDGTLTIADSTLSGNSASTGDGGGVRNGSIMTLTNSTLSGNSASDTGGAIFNDGALTMRNSTLSGNSASISGGVYSDNALSYANTIIANSITNSVPGGDCHGDIGTNINNLVEDGSCSLNGTNFITGDPKLDYLDDNGGPTQTFALLTGSSAIDAGDDITCTNSPVNGLDQRDVIRPVGAQCDIGAYEGSIADPRSPVVNSFTATSPSAGLNITITAFTASDNLAVTGYKISESSTPPSAGAAGWTASAPTTYTVGSDGAYTLYPWAKDAAGNVSSVYGSPASVTVDTTGPNITINNPNTSPATSKTITASASDGTLTMSNTTGSTCNGSLIFVAYSSQTFTSISDNGMKVCYKAVDAFGNTAYSLSNAIAGIKTFVFLPLVLNK